MGSDLNLHSLPNRYVNIQSYFGDVGLEQSLVLFLFGLRFDAPVNIYDHVEIISSPNHIFSGQA